MSQNLLTTRYRKSLAFFDTLWLYVPGGKKSRKSPARIKNHAFRQSETCNKTSKAFRGASLSSKARRSQPKQRIKNVKTKKNRARNRLTMVSDRRTRCLRFDRCQGWRTTKLQLREIEKCHRRRGGYSRRTSDRTSAAILRPAAGRF